MGESRPRLRDLPQLTHDGHYAPRVDWRDLEALLERWTTARAGARLDLAPDFQRGHVWSRTQQMRYVEFMLSGGRGADTLALQLRRVGRQLPGARSSSSTASSA